VLGTERSTLADRPAQEPASNRLLAKLSSGRQRWSACV